MAEGECRAPDAIVDGNRLTLLTEGPERLAALIGLIDGARASLRLLYYMYNDDEAGQRVLAALERAARRGVTVSVIIDGFGSDASSDFFDPLAASGAEVCRFIPKVGRRYLLRNHQKMALADAGTGASRAIVGGFNVGRDYFAVPRQDAWRDLGLVVAGPAASHLAGYFDTLSAWTKTPNGRIRTLRRALRRWSQTEGPLRWLFGGPARRLSPWARVLKADLQKARRLDVIAAYFAPNPAMLRRIERIAHRELARLITAAHSDNTATIAAARHCYGRLLRRGVEVYEYQPARLHTKLFVLDDAVHVGSANFDMRSLYINLELMLRVEDPQFAARCRAYVEGEIAQSDRIEPAQHRRASTLWARIRWALAYFAVSVVDYNVSRRLNFGPDGR